MTTSPVAGREVERTRLEKEVVEAAKAEYSENPFLQSMASRRFRNAIIELENFEASASVDECHTSSKR